MCKFILKTAVVLFILFTFDIWAVPATPGLVKMKQPDGSIVTVYLHGNEYLNWITSEDGHMLMYDEDKYLVFAVLDEQQNMIPSSIRAKDITERSSDDLHFLEAKTPAFYSASQIKALNQIRQIEEKALRSAKGLAAKGDVTVGDIRVLCALAAFKDEPFKYTKEDFDLLMNQEGYHVYDALGSVKDYFKEVTYGKVNLTVDVFGPVTLAHDAVFYGANDTPSHVDTMILEVAALIDPMVNYADYDLNQDGNVDVFHIIYAGESEASGGGPNTIWPHKSFFPQPYPVYDGKKLVEYSCSSELIDDTITTIGVITHEVSHVFGMLDYYDADYAVGGNYAGTGTWDLMASGSWNKWKRRGDCPSHINMYEKINNEWVQPVILSGVQDIVNMPCSADSAVAYIIQTPTEGEYYILENKQMKKFDRKIPGSGLFILHKHADIDSGAFNSVNRTHPQKLYPVCANVLFKTPVDNPNSYGNVNSDGTPFPGSSGMDVFGDSTVPAMFSWGGGIVNAPLSKIAENDGLISFSFGKPIVPAGYHPKQVENIRDFLRQPSAVSGKLNLEQVGLKISDTASWNTSVNWMKKVEGLIYNKANEKEIVRINWDDAKLAGVLDLKNCTTLTYIECSYSRLEQLNLSNSKKLTNLYCGNNHLTDIRLPETSLLTEIECINNRLTQLNLQKVQNLTWLNCADNELSSLDLSKNTSLISLRCTGNKLKFSTLPQGEIKDKLETFVYMPQDTVRETAIKDTIDLSSEYDVQGQYTTYHWFDVSSGKENAITLTGEGGKFIIDKSYLNKTLRCKMSNEYFSSSNRTPLVYELKVSPSQNKETEHLQPSTYIIYPNPTNGPLTVLSKEQGQRVNKQLFNLFGQLIVDTFEDSFNISHLPTGIYLLKVQGDVIKIVKD